MKVNIAVCGKFHILNYVKKINEIGLLNRIFFSHRKQSGITYGIPKEKSFNFSTKEHLIQLHGRLLGTFGYEMLIPTYHAIWARSVLHYWEPSPILHYLSQGACLPVLNRARSDGAKLICEAVNTHPMNRLLLLSDEARKWNIPVQRTNLLERERLQIAEASEADILLCPSKIVAQTYRENGLSTKEVIIPYAANVTMFGDRDLPIKRRSIHEPLKIICIGRIGLRKGQLYLLEGIKSLNPAHFSLTLVGTVDKEIINLIKKMDVYVNHIKRVPHEEMPTLLASHHVFAAPSLEEGLAVSICEALAMGLAVIATPESGAEEIIKNGVNGLIVPSRSSRSLADAFTLLHENEDMRQRLGFEGRKSTHHTINWDQYAFRLSQLYKALAQ